MKKNILTIIILAATLVNLTLTAVSLFVVVPTANRANNLLIKIVQMIDLDIETPIVTSLPEGELGAADIFNYPIEDKLTITLKKLEGSSKANYCTVKASINLNNKAKDFENIKKLLEANIEKVKETITDVIGSYTKDNVDDSKEAIKETLVAELQTYFQTDTIVDIVFSQFLSE